MVINKYDDDLSAVRSKIKYKTVTGKLAFV